MTNKITLSISKKLKQKLEERIKQTNFKSIPDYLLFVLEQMTSEIETKKQAYTKEEEAGVKGNSFGDEKNKKRKGYNEEEEADMKKDLEDWGYM